MKYWYICKKKPGNVYIYNGRIRLEMVATLIVTEIYAVYYVLEFEIY